MKVQMPDEDDEVVAHTETAGSSVEILEQPDQQC